MEKNIFNSFLTEIFVSKFLKFLTKISMKRLLNILFSIKMENIIFNSYFTDIFISPFVYKVIVCIYIFSCIEAELHKKDRFGAGLEPSAVFRCNACRPCTLEPVILAIPEEVCNV